MSPDSLGEETKASPEVEGAGLQTPCWGLSLISGVGTEGPLQPTGPSQAGLGPVAVSSAAQPYAAWPGLPVPTVPLISWHWPWQGQHTASPGCSAPSSDLARPGREGSPQAEHSLGAPCPGPGRAAPLMWADSSCLQRAPQTPRGDACQEAHPRLPPGPLLPPGPSASLLPSFP